MRLRITSRTLDLLFSREQRISLADVDGLREAVERASPEWREKVVYAIDLATLFSTVAAIDALEGVIEGDVREYEEMRIAAILHRSNELEVWREVYRILNDTRKPLMEESYEARGTLKMFARLHSILNNRSSEELYLEAEEEKSLMRAERFMRLQEVAKKGVELLEGKATVRLKRKAPQSLR